MSSAERTPAFRSASRSVRAFVASAKGGELQSEGGKLRNVVVQEVHAALDRLDPVELDGVLGRVRLAEGIEVEVLAELAHSCAQGDEMTVHVAEPIENFGLQNSSALRVARLQY